MVERLERLIGDLKGRGYAFGTYSEFARLKTEELKIRNHEISHYLPLLQRA